MRAHIRIITIALILMAASNSTLWAKGLSTGFSEVTLEGLETGRTYSTQEAADMPLAIVNTGEEPIDLRIELLSPGVSELKADFEPIPDLKWVRLSQTEFTGINPKEAATTDVVICIPDNEEYRGKKYQIFIWSHSIGAKIGVGLKSKLLFTIKNE